VANTGPNDVVGATVSDIFPSALLSHTWTAIATLGATTSISGIQTGNIADTVNVPVGGNVTYTVTALVDSTAVGSLTNFVTVTAPAGVNDTDTSNNISTDSDPLTPQADLDVRKILTTNPAVPGNPASYTLTVRNLGPSTIGSFTLTDTLPTILLNPQFTPSAGTYSSSTGLWTVTLDPNQAVTLILTGVIDPAARGTISNAVDVAPPANVSDPDLNNNHAGTTDPLVPIADLGVVKTGNTTVALPGTTVKYTITVTNFGPSTIFSLMLTDTLPGQLTNPVFAANTGAYDPVTGAWSGVNLATGQNVVLTITGKVAANAMGTLLNRVIVGFANAPGEPTDPNPANNEATFSMVVIPSKRIFLVSFLRNRIG
jgi:uncharacterized repeat protein (TIGR01451 family)